MAEDERTRRWQRLSPAERREVDPLHALRNAISAVRNEPRDGEARRRLRALGVDQGSWEQLALLLTDEARAAEDRPEVAAAFYEELADVHENLDQPFDQIAAMEAVVRLVPDAVEHLDRLAWLYRRAGAALKAADTFARVARLAPDERARAALRAAGVLYRESGKHEDALRAYRGVVEVKPSDREAWRALDEILSELKRWREVAELRAQQAELASGVDKAVLLRAQARALEQVGEAGKAAELVASAAGHAPEDVSGLVDFATVLAREGRAREAAQVLSTRIQEAVADGAPAADVAALRLRLVDVLDGLGDHEAAEAALDKLLAVMPEHVPALERLVQHAARDPDPATHAVALLRHAAALDGPESYGLIREAARRFRDAGDLRSAVRHFERALEMSSTDDPTLHDELEEARTALVVEIAIVEASTGDTREAERKLRGILVMRPLHVAANLALVDLMTTTDRLAEAAEHLRTTLASAPEDTEPRLLAKLVLRYARVMNELGERDEAHQLLHEAHHMDRRDLQITLALGESCFSRKLWREAAIHLGSLAEHPDARRHASAVAAGLFKAGQAEVRALKPQNAIKHWEAATRVDIECAPAWHSLAQIATERGDMVRAAECLEREASATKEPATRLRLFDALGDLALDVLGDEERAERCWSRVATAGSAPVLEKLLVLQRKRGALIERGENCERLAALSDNAGLRKDLTEEAAEAFFAGGDPSRAAAVSQFLVANYPHDITTLLCASKIVLAHGDAELVAGWLRRALGMWDAAGQRGEADSRHAELWRRLGDAERARRNERAALEAYQRAVQTAPDSEGALGARRGLIELAKSSGRAEQTARLAVVEAEQEPADIIAAARELAAAKEYEEARSMYELARALGVELVAADEDFLEQHPPRLMAADEAYANALEERERRALVDERDEGALAEILSLIGEAASLVCPDPKTALDNEALSDARRISTTTSSPVIAMYPQVAKALGGPPTLLYTSPDPQGPDLRLVVATPPVVLISPRLAELDSLAKLRFQLGRIVELSRPHRLFSTNVARLGLLVAGIWHAFGKPELEIPRDVAREAERLHHALPVQLRRRIGERLAVLASPTALDPQAYIAACNRAADRAGLLACGHVGVALDQTGGARHVLALASSQKYLAARRKLRHRVS